MERIALLGSSKLCQRLVYYFEATGFATVVGMLDDFEVVGTVKYDRPIIGRITDAPALFSRGVFDVAAIAIGYEHRKVRKDTFDFVRSCGIPMPPFVHPTSHVEPSARVSDGCIVLVDCTIDANARLEENVFLSSRGFVSHDVVVGAHTYCAPCVNLAGDTVIGECCFLGINTTIIDGVTIGSNVQTAAGAVVTKDVKPDVLVAGVPAVVKRKIPPL